MGSIPFRLDKDNNFHREKMTADETKTEIFPESGAVDFFKRHPGWMERGEGASKEWAAEIKEGENARRK